MDYKGMGEHKAINEFKKGEVIQDFYIIKSSALKTTNANKKYVDFVMGDCTGEVNAKYWDYDEARDGQCLVGTLVKIRGTVTEWQNQLQLKIELIRAAKSEDGLNIEDFVQSAPLTSEKMLGDILKYVISIKNKDIREIVSAIINENREKLMIYPAAMKNHHSIRSGLLYHILTMLNMAEKVMEVYSLLNRDLLLAGVIIHDMAKIEEMNANQLGIVTEYTSEGMLLGHLIQGIKNVERIGESIGADKETVILLEHMILSHHYEPEFGSPKRPMIPEAEILHYLDLMDARMYDMKKALDNVEGGNFTDRVWLLHNRQLYKPLIQDEDNNISENENKA